MVGRRREKRAYASGALVLVLVLVCGCALAASADTPGDDNAALKEATPSPEASLLGAMGPLFNAKAEVPDTQPEIQHLQRLSAEGKVLEQASPNPPPPPGNDLRGGDEGACCVGEECVNVCCDEECDQYGGVFYPGEDCYGNPPFECPPMGACCVVEQCVATNTESECSALGGAWYEGESCYGSSPFECPPPMGACCVAEQCVATNTEDECSGLGGAWYEGEDCYGSPPFECPSEGACCVAEQCVATNTENECSGLGGTWYEGEDCYGNPPFECPPLGACCVGDGCVATNTEAQCLGLGGAWYEGEDCYGSPPFECPPVGACCVDFECVATNTEAQCAAFGGLWYEGENCFGNPPFDCPRLGACCVDLDCVGTNFETECLALGGRWYEDEDCFGDPPFACPDTEADFYIWAPCTTPVRNTCGAVNDCDQVYGSEDHTYEVVIPYDGVWEFDCQLCLLVPFNDVLHVGTTLCGYEVGMSSPMLLHMPLRTPLTAGNYFVTIESIEDEGEEYSCGTYYLAVQCLDECTCFPDDTPEGEPDCYNNYYDHFNGGCNSSPPVFSRIENNEIVCGTTGQYYYGDHSHYTGSRDTDWYEFELDRSANVTCTACGNLPIIIYIVDGHGGSCEGLNDDWIIAGDSGAYYEAASVSAYLLPGTYWFWVGPPHALDPRYPEYPCGTEYVATLSYEAVCDEDSEVELWVEMTAGYGPDGPDTTWEVIDYDTGEVAVTGGPYPDGTTYIQEFHCLDRSTCYEFTMYSAGGYGQSGSNSGYTIKLDSYVIADSYGGGGWYGSSETVADVFGGGDDCMPDGACCLGMTCIATCNEIECDAMGGEFWYEGEDCFGSPPFESPGIAVDYVVRAPYSSPMRSVCGEGGTERCSLTLWEHVYLVNIPDSGRWVFSLCDSEFDTCLYVGATECGSEIGYNFDSCGEQSLVSANIDAGDYFITIGGDRPLEYYGHVCGDYILDVYASGDLNCDGEVDFGDINPFVLALTDPMGYEAAYPDCKIMTGDINGDGEVDFGDINPFVALLTGG